MTVIEPTAGPCRVAVAPLLMVRVSGISPSVLNGLIMRETVTLVAAVGHARRRERAAAAHMVTVLHNLVPLLDDDRRLRRAALALKRAVHNDRPSGVSAGDLEALRARLSDGARGQFATWEQAAAEVRSLLARAEHTTHDELTAANTALADAYAAPALLRAVALASPTFAAELAHGDIATRLTPGSRLGRSCFGYLVRAAVKTSPFSTFTTVGRSTVGQDRTDPDAEAAVSGRSRLALAPALGTDLVLAMAVSPEFGPALRYRLSEGVCWAGDDPTVLASRASCSTGFFWRHESVVAADAYATVLRRLRATAGAAMTYGELLAGLGGAGAQSTVSRLVELGLVQPLAPWTTNSRSALPALAAAVRSLGTPDSERLADTLIDMTARVAATVAATPQRRTNATDAVRATARSAFRTAGRVPPPWLDAAPLLYEDVETDVAVPAFGSEVASDLERLGDRLRPRVFRSHLYADLVDHFVSRYGAGGTCPDVRQFLYAFLRRPDASRILAAGAREDGRRQTLAEPDAPLAPSSRAPRCIDVDGSRPAMTVLFQVAAASRTAVARGDYLLVVNTVQTGAGGMVARYLPLFGDDLAMPQRLRRWVRECCGDARPVEITMASDWHGLQPPTGLFQRLRWPSEVPTADDHAAIGLTDVVLTHEPRTSTLGLLDRDGRRVAPVYLGTVPPYLATGPLRLLLALADPWILAATPPPRRRPIDPALAVPAVQVQDRLTDGRLVLHRRRWRVPLDDLPFPLANDSAFGVLARAAAWRERWDIPEEVFATVERPRLRVGNGDHKPVWLSFASVHSLAYVGAMLGDGDIEAVTLTEALPKRDHGWLSDPDGAGRASEAIALLRWTDRAP